MLCTETFGEFHATVRNGHIFWLLIRKEQKLNYFELI